MENADCKWLFITVEYSQLPPCVAFRAAQYVSNLSKHNPELVKKFNERFKTKYNNMDTVVVTPLVRHCLFISAKIETRKWEQSRGIFNFTLRHNFALTRSVISPMQYSKMVMEMDLEISTALEWRLMPKSPFQCLQELQEISCFEFMTEAIDLCKRCIIYEVCVFCPFALACGTVVAGEVLRSDVVHEPEKRAMVRSLAATVLFVAIPSTFEVTFESIVSASERIEDLEARVGECASIDQSSISPHPRNKKQKQAFDVESPDSVVLFRVGV